MRVYRLATITRGSDGTISVQNVQESHGTVLAGALLGGVSGLAGGPLGVALGAGAGALLGWTAEQINEEGVTDLAKHMSKLPFGKRAILAEVSEEALSSVEALVTANGGMVYN